MRTFCECNIETGRIIQRGRCENQSVPRMLKGSAIAFITTSSIADTITFTEVDVEGIAVDPILHKATEGEKTNRCNATLEPRRIFPVEVDDDKPARITRKDLAALVQRVKDLEDR